MAPSSTTSTHDESTTSHPPAIVPISARHDLPIKLSHKNFTSWCAHLMALLRGHNLLGFVDGSCPRPARATDGSNAVAIDIWVEQDQLLLAAIFGSLTAEILPLVSSTSTAAEAWGILNHLCMRPEYDSIVGPIRARESTLQFEELHDLLCAHESILLSSAAATASLVATANAPTAGFDFTSGKKIEQKLLDHNQEAERFGVSPMLIGFPV
ncbi:hypothetical protein ACS0TY_029813 [Phlomoides rotata]